MNLKLGCLKIVKIESPEKPEFQQFLDLVAKARS